MATSPRWPDAERYVPLVDAAVREHGGIVPPALVLAMIAVESGFNPKAYRAEVKIGDASRGLMQLLLKTARGLGYSGSADGLYDPAVNIGLGVKYLSALVRERRGDIGSAISAYNNGHGRRAEKPTTVCLRRDGRGECVESYTAQPGEFLNQPYVTKVLRELRVFDPGLSALPVQASLWSLVVYGGITYLVVRLARS